MVYVKCLTCSKGSVCESLYPIITELSPWLWLNLLLKLDFNRDE